MPQVSLYLDACKNSNFWVGYQFFLVPFSSGVFFLSYYNSLSFSFQFQAKWQVGCVWNCVMRVLLSHCYYKGSFWYFASWINERICFCWVDYIPFLSLHKEVKQGERERERMIQLLFMVLFVEGVMAFLLLVKVGPFRDLVIKALDQVKMGKGPATVKTIAGTMSVILLSSLMSIVKIQNKGAKLGTMSPMDQVLWRTHLLEASLMGAFMLLSSLFILHPCLFVSVLTHFVVFIVLLFLLKNKVNFECCREVFMCLFAWPFFSLGCRWRWVPLFSLSY